MFSLKSPAKINLSLKIRNQRNDGLHELFNIMCFLDLYDTIKIKENKSVFPSLFVSGKYGHLFDNFHTASIESNTIIKALDFMHSHYKIPMNFDISVSKEIPVGGGLGGSGTNAGTVINFMCQYFGIEIQNEMMSLIVEEVGSDVPFFTQDKAALCEGAGERVTPINFSGDTKSLPVLILYPNFQLESKKIYSKYISNSTGAESDTLIADWKSFLSTGNIDFAKLVTEAVSMGNDLTEYIIQDRQEIGIILKEMQNCSGVNCCGVSGSGSACFAIFHEESKLQDAVIEMSGKFPACEVIPSAILPSFAAQNVVMSSRPAMEMIFHGEQDEEEWKKIQ